MALRTLFLHPPSFEGFDGGAGSRYQARREIRSFWYPTWLAQPAALVPGSRLVDAPPDGLTVDQVAPLAREYDHVVMHTSTPSFGSDVRVAERLKHENPGVLVGMVGAHVAVLPAASLGAARAVDWVGVGEFDHACAEVSEGRRLADVKGIAYRDGDRVRFTPPRPPIEDMDALPFVVDVYRRDLTIENYFIGYLLHPYVSLYTGRGCRSKCTFCLWPQTVGGHRYRVRSPESVEAEIARAKRHFPQVREFFFDDDTFTDDLPAGRADRSPPGPSGCDLVVQREGERAAEDARDPEGQRPSPPAGRLRVRGSGDPEQHQEGRAPRRRPGVHAEREGCRDHDSRDLHPRPPGGDARDDPGDDPLRVRDRAGHDPGLSRGALPGHGAPPSGRGARVAPADRGRPGEPGRGPGGRPGLPRSRAIRDLRLGGGVLSPVLLPPPEDRRDGRGDAARSGCHAAPTPGGRRVLQVPAGAAGELDLGPRPAASSAGS